MRAMAIASLSKGTYFLSLRLKAKERDFSIEVILQDAARLWMA